MGPIVDIQVARLQQLLEDRKIRLDLTDAARAWLGRVGYDPVYGARPLKRAVQKYLQDPLADKILAGEIPDGSVVRVDEGDGALVLTPSQSCAKPPNKALARRIFCSRNLSLLGLLAIAQPLFLPLKASHAHASRRKTAADHILLLTDDFAHRVTGLGPRFIRRLRNLRRNRNGERQARSNRQSEFHLGVHAKPPWFAQRPQPALYMPAWIVNKERRLRSAIERQRPRSGARLG